jgi:ATP-dependent RNA helicase RhlE
MTFDTLGLSADLLRTVAEEGYEQPTPVQAKSIPLVLEGRDVPRGRPDRDRQDRRLHPADPRSAPKHANTSFSPARHPVRALILVPTRELAMQVDESVRTYGRTVPLRSTVVYGGMPMEPQIKALRDGVEILVATPGRLLDLVGQRVANLGQVEILVLDEAGPACSTWASCRTSSGSSALLPAATPEPDVLGHVLGRDPASCRGRSCTTPIEVEVAPRNATVDAIRQIVYPVDRDRKESCSPT